MNKNSIENLKKQMQDATVKTHANVTERLGSVRDSVLKEFKFN